MAIVTDAKRNFRRYRLYNKAAHPFRFWLIDSAILLARIAVLLLFLAIIYMLLRTTSFGPFGNLLDRGANAATVQQPAVQSTAAVVTPAIIAAKASPPNATAPQPVAPQPAASAPVPGLADSQPVSGPQAPEILGPSWLLTQSVGDYTIQFASASNVAKLVEFSNQFTDGGAVTIYPFQQREGQIVYGLARGIYTDFASARKAILALPEELQQKEPWIRAIDKLQTEISAFQAE